MSDSSFWEQLVLGFLEHLEVERNLSRYTIRNYHHYLSRFVEWLLKSNSKAKLKDVNLKLITKYRLYLSRLVGRNGSPLSRATQSYHVIALRSFLKWLTKRDYQVLSPEKIDLPKGESRRLTFLNRGQVERLLVAPSISTERGLRDKAILEMLFSTGLRVSELVKLDRDQVDIERREFGVVGKGRRPRVVFLSDRATKWLKKYFDKRSDHWQPVFIRYSRDKAGPESSGEKMRLTVRSVQRIVEKYRKHAKLPIKITPHGLRHSFATDLLHAGAGLREIQEMLGHKNVSTTQIYTHVTNPQLKKVHQKYHSGNK